MLPALDRVHTMGAPAGTDPSPTSHLMDLKESDVSAGADPEVQSAGGIALETAAVAGGKPAGDPDCERPPRQEIVSEPGADKADRPAGGAGTLRAGLKLVVSLRRDGGPAYRALIALGADGCDPLLRSAEVADLSCALDLLPALIAEAEARWQVQPRQPAARLPQRAPRGKPADSNAAQPPVPRESPEELTAARRDPAPAPSPSGQLPLFG